MSKIAGKPLKVREARKASFTGFRGSVALLTPWFQISTFQNCEIMNFFCFRPPSLWNSAMTTLGKQCITSFHFTSFPQSPHGMMLLFSPVLQIQKLRLRKVRTESKLIRAAWQPLGRCCLGHLGRSAGGTYVGAWISSRCLLGAEGSALQSEVKEEDCGDQKFWMTGV